MSKASSINSLTALRERREEIKVEQQAARRGLTSTLSAAPQKAKDYALEDLALPALGIGLAAYVAYRVLRTNKHPDAIPVQTSYVQPEMNTAASPPTAQDSPEAVRRAPRQEQTGQAAKQRFNFATLISAGKLLIPAAQAIIGIIQDHQGTGPLGDTAKEAVSEAGAQAEGAAAGAV